jgi:hypothetical protein
MIKAYKYREEKRREREKRKGVQFLMIFPFHSFYLKAFFFSSIKNVYIFIKKNLIIKKIPRIYFFLYFSNIRKAVVYQLSYKNQNKNR